MHVFSDGLMYVIPQSTIRELDLEFEQLLVDAGKMSHEDFVSAFKRKEAENAAA